MVVKIVDISIFSMFAFPQAEFDVKSTKKYAGAKAARNEKVSGMFMLTKERRRCVHAHIIYQLFFFKYHNTTCNPCTLSPKQRLLLRKWYCWIQKHERAGKHASESSINNKKKCIEQTLFLPLFPISPPYIFIYLFSVSCLFTHLIVVSLSIQVCPRT
jgi:hypothetical protein